MDGERAGGGGAIWESGRRGEGGSRVAFLEKKTKAKRDEVFRDGDRKLGKAEMIEKTF